MMILGGPVKGGKVYGKWPGLSTRQALRGPRPRDHHRLPRRLRRVRHEPPRREGHLEGLPGVQLQTEAGLHQDVVRPKDQGTARVQSGYAARYASHTTEHLARALDLGLGPGLSLTHLRVTLLRSPLRESSSTARELRANIAAMQARANAAGVRLRPHAKTHKSPDDRALADRRRRGRHLLREAR